MDKYVPDDIPNINSTCFKLNSLQLQALLQNYHCAPDEPFIPPVSEYYHDNHEEFSCLHRKIGMKGASKGKLSQCCVSNLAHLK